MSSLKASFDQRKSWVNNRASTVFPYFPTVIQAIVFQDYWAWKSDLTDKIAEIIVRDCKGTIVHYHHIQQIYNHNNYIIPSDLCDGGMIEIEIKTKENIRFPFPAVMMFVFSADNKWVSCVHSGGRILNDNESKAWVTSVESNFYCQLNNSFSPFFHIFNGPENIQQSLDDFSLFKVEIRSAIDNAILYSVPYTPPVLPYSSSLFHLSDLLDQNNIQIDSNISFYLRIYTLSYGIFPRLICGNIHKDTNFPFVTHSFKCYDNDIYDDVQATSDNNVVSMFFPICCAFPLDLQIRSYPTNNSMLVVAKQEDQRTKSISEFGFKTGSKDAGIQIFDSGGGHSIVRTYGSAPSRLNCSLNYSLSNSLHPTDIATGFKCIDYPPKYSHWGHGIISNHFDTLLFVRWIELPNNESKVFETELLITIFNESISIDFQIVITQDQITTVNLSNYFHAASFLIQESIVSWRFNSEIPNIECFWVAYNSETGAIAGEHGF